MLNNRRWRPLAAARRLIMSRSDLPSKLLRQLHAEIGPWRDEHDPPGTCALLQSGLYINKPFKYRWDLYLVKLKNIYIGTRLFTAALFKMLINNRSIYCRLSCHQSNDTVKRIFAMEQNTSNIRHNHIKANTITYILSTSVRHVRHCAFDVRY